MVVHQLPNSPSMKIYYGSPSPALNGETPFGSVGNVLGGDSSVNFMMYARPSASYVPIL